MLPHWTFLSKLIEKLCLICHQCLGPPTIRLQDRMLNWDDGRGTYGGPHWSCEELTTAIKASLSGNACSQNWPKPYCSPVLLFASKYSDSLVCMDGKSCSLLSESYLTAVIHRAWIYCNVLYLEIRLTVLNLHLVWNPAVHFLKNTGYTNCISPGFPVLTGSLHI